MEQAVDIRYVVLHTPGPEWVIGVHFTEQPGVRDHVLHYRRLLEQGKLELGGPFVTADSGGMMVPSAGVSQEEIEAFAASDPAVQQGLLKYELRPWYVAMKQPG